MPYNTKTLKRDQAGAAAPQYFNTSTDEYEPLEGQDGAIFVKRLDSGGAPAENRAVTLIASGAYTSTQTSPDQKNRVGRGVTVFIDVSAMSDTPQLTPVIDGKDPVSGGYVAIASGAAITSTGLYRMRLYPGIAAVSGEAFDDILPLDWRFRMVHDDADEATYSVAAVVQR